jgi:hypothetical protein
MLDIEQSVHTHTHTHTHIYIYILRNSQFPFQEEVQTNK